MTNQNRNYPTRMHEVLGVGTMTDTEDYIVFDRTGTPHVVVAVKTERVEEEEE